LTLHFAIAEALKRGSRLGVKVWETPDHA